MSRHACYLMIQNAYPSKEVVAQGQTYFAIKTRRLEFTDAEVEERQGTDTFHRSFHPPLGAPFNVVIPPLLPTRIQTIFQTAKINKTAFVQEYPRDIVLADVPPSSQAVLCQPPVFSKKVPKSA